MNRLRQQRFDAAFLDLRLGREAGMDLLPVLLRKAPGLAVIVITAHASISSAVEAMRAGAFDYLPKPFTPDQLRVVLERWRQVQRLRNRVANLEEQVRAVTPETDLETREPAMRQALELAFQVAASEATVLLRGESGTGKGVLARAIHERSPRRAARSSLSTVPAFRANCWRASFSVMFAAPSRERCSTPRARWRRPREAACSSMRSATCRRPCSPSCCACCKIAATSASAKRKHGSPMSVLSRRRTGT